VAGDINHKVVMAVHLPLFNQAQLCTPHLVALVVLMDQVILVEMAHLVAEAVGHFTQEVIALQ
jgi:hypothetical protein